LNQTGRKANDAVSLWAALAILLGVAALEHWTIDVASATLGLVEHSGTVLQRIDDVAIDSSRSVMARRDYVVAGDAELLANAKELDAKVFRSLAAVRSLVADNPRQRERCESLAELFHQRIADLDVSVKRRQTEGRGTESMEGLVLANRIQGLRDEMDAEEDRLLRERDALVRRQMTRTQAGESAGILLSIFILLSLFGRLRREIAQRQESERGLAESETFLRSIVEHIPDMIFVKDAAGLRYERINRAGEELLGIEREDLLHKADSDFLPADQAAVFRARDRETLKRGVPVDTPEERIETKKGQRWLHTKTVPIVNERGEPKHLLGISEDITERREAAAALKSATKATEAANVELREARGVADAANRAKSDFLSSMSHELRTPLSAIFGFAQLLQRDKKEPISDRHRERVDQILNGGRHLLRLIDDILDLSRIEAGSLSMSIAPVDVVEVLSEVTTTLGPMAARNGIRMDVEALQGHPSTVAADRTRFAQILMNFGSNAIKYNRPSGRVTFVVSAPTPGYLRVGVRDNGFGIPVEQQDKLFQPFQRAGQECGPIEGTGIGLVITKRLAELMHGSVGFRSVPGDGSEFWVDTPIHVGEALPSAQGGVGGSLSDRPLGEVPRLILYIEDNPANVTFMRDLVGSYENIELITAPTAERGLDLARKHHPDVIIMDIYLPGMTGIDALHDLRARHETNDIPVIALTAAASKHDNQRGLQAGFDRYLTKPVQVDELLRALEGVLAPSGDGAESHVLRDRSGAGTGLGE
jgi:PAS domain S-box-containing protein